MSRAPSSLLFWLVVVAAAIILAPYAGIHILTSPPDPQEQRVPVDISIQPAPQAEELANEQTESGESPGARAGSLDEINGLLTE